MYNQKRTKKQAKFSWPIPSYHFITLEIIILLVATTLTFSSYQSQTIKKNFLPKPISLAKEVKAASISAESSPGAVPKVEIPQATGKQVRVPILMYHYIGKNPNPADKLRDNLSVDPSSFDDQINYLSKNGFTPITFDTLLAGLSGNTILPQKPIIITLDDGYIDLYVNAYPILKRYNFKAVAFIPTGLIGTGYYATWPEVQEMQSSGIINMQAHSVHHLSLINLSHDQLVYEITESKKTLESKLGVPINFMAYPYGTTNSTVWNEVKKAGYLGAAGTWFGDTISEGTIFDMPRIKIPGGIDINTFASKI